MEPDAESRVLHDEAFHDDATMEEIDLYSELLIAAGSADGRLSSSELDRILGLRESAA
ncbi:MAG: hypothetical protein NVSMB13_15910 [Mycobacteriales bacterium]